MDGILRPALPFIVLGLVGYFFYVVGRSLITGRIAVADDEFYRAERPGPYWLWLGAYAFGALVALGLGVKVFVEGFA